MGRNHQDVEVDSWVFGSSIAQQSETYWLWVERSRSMQPLKPHREPGPARRVIFFWEFFQPTISATLYSQNSVGFGLSWVLKELQKLNESSILTMAKAATRSLFLKRSKISAAESYLLKLALKTKSKGKPSSHCRLQKPEGAQKGLLRQQSLVVSPSLAMRSIALRMLALVALQHLSSMVSVQSSSCWADNAYLSLWSSDTALETTWASSLAHAQPAHRPSLQISQSAYLTRVDCTRRSYSDGTASARARSEQRTRRQRMIDLYSADAAQNIIRRPIIS